MLLIALYVRAISPQQDPPIGALMVSVACKKKGLNFLPILKNDIFGHFTPEAKNILGKIDWVTCP